MDPMNLVKVKFERRFVEKVLDGGQDAVARTSLFYRVEQVAVEAAIEVDIAPTGS